MKTKWTMKNIGDLTGKIAIVTGANSGIGYETAHTAISEQIPCPAAGYGRPPAYSSESSTSSLSNVFFRIW